MVRATLKNMSDQLNDLCASTHPLVQDAPRQCTRCAAPLCLRKQVVNLALGNTEEMLCLECLAADGADPPAQILGDMISYINQRQCFHKEWIRYTGVAYCPDQAGCFPAICFAGGESNS